VRKSPASAPESREADAPRAAKRTVGVVELGTTSIRMAVAQVDEKGVVRPLDMLNQAVSLGRDTFTRGGIGAETTEACVKVLRGFARTLREYGVSDPGSVSAVATSAVREAANAYAFLDRISIATGFDVKVLDEAEVNRFTYLAVLPHLRADARMMSGDTLVVEVGGGSTEALLFRDGRVAGAHTYRLGSLRLRQAMEESRLPGRRAMQITRNEIDRAIRHVLDSVPVAGERRPGMLALGGDIRFACLHLAPARAGAERVSLSAAGLSAFADEILGLSVDEVVKRHHVSYPDAETLGPALLVYARLADALKVRRIRVCKATLRDGLVAELVSGGSWTPEFERQVVSSALETGAKYRFDRGHAERVADYARVIFDALEPEHHLGQKHRLILTVAALLHETGEFVSNRSHHKHSQYLILNSDIFGLGSRDLVVTALVARYHRQSPPKPTHELYVSLSRQERVVVAKLAAILRVADALTTRPGGRGGALRVGIAPGEVNLALEDAGDLTLQQHRLRQKGNMFEQVYGMRVGIRGRRGTAHEEQAIDVV